MTDLGIAPAGTAPIPTQYPYHVACEWNFSIYAAKVPEYRGKKVHLARVEIKNTWIFVISTKCFVSSTGKCHSDAIAQKKAAARTHRGNSHVNHRRLRCPAAARRLSYAVAFLTRMCKCFTPPGL
jgi:hypothetical protein